MAGGMTTAAPATTAAAATLAGAAETMTTAAAATTTTAAGAAGPPVTDQAPTTFVATQDRKAMIKAIETAQTPAFVSFRAPVTPPTDSGTGTQDSTTSSAGSAATSSASATDTTAGPATETTAPITSATDAVTPEAKVFAPVTEEAAANVVAQLEGFTGMQPLDPSLWLGGPTYAAFLSRQDAEELVDLVRSIGASVGLVVRLEGGPPAAVKESSGRLLENKSLFPMLRANRALQPATWGYDFTTSSVTRASGDQAGTATPDEAGTHVIIVIWIAE
jgi:hypothetical protein